MVGPIWRPAATVRWRQKN